MAKASKNDSPAKSPSKSPAKSTAKPAAKKTAKNKAPAKSARTSKPAAPTAAGVIDTDLAAQSAARMLLARAAGGHAPATTPHAESSTFKHLKEQISKPKGALNNLLQSTGGQSAVPGSHLPHSRGPAGRGQTHGADVSRTGVPRRTNG